MRSHNNYQVSCVRAVILMTALILPGISLGQAQQQNQTRSVVARRAVENKQLESMDAQLRSVETKINQLIQSQGGRFVFIVSGDGEFVRLDTQKGEIAVFSLVKGARWFTLDIPEQTIRPGDAFYEQFVQTIDKLEFNTN
ncbi:hypothetical protein [Rubellicoccus peritrichatus]|uniref:Uncharacterized protein n=1 Tax=Rubellicoccus peritrichatus TaxID=3080537 RepID=A0AAQ3L983_9BACT|nr:hypothetical protein [Puniceicoccus sp. CR14]WOO41171.1 hypothetical protein RZN69_21330 [Puniceicoccus sp. CR14]